MGKEQKIKAPKEKKSKRVTTESGSAIIKNSGFSRFRALLRRNEMAGYVFLLPWLIGLFAFVGYPLVMSIVYATSKVNVTANGIVTEFLGWGNFEWVFQKNTKFIESAIGFLSNTLLSLPVILVFSMIVAMMLNTNIRLKGFFRTIFFLPVVIVSGPVMQQLSSQGATTVPMIQESGMISALTSFLPPMFAEPITYVFQQIITILWFSGVQILIILAGLQKIDSSIYEAASIDGASGWESFWKITLPSLKPMLLLNAIYTLVSLAQHDDNNVITTIKSTLLDANKGGYDKASAMAWVYMFVLLILLGIIFLIFKDRNKKSLATKKAERQQKELIRLRRKQKRRRGKAA